jgi:hypothetical protein
MSGRANEWLASERGVSLLFAAAVGCVGCRGRHRIPSLGGFAGQWLLVRFGAGWAGPVSLSDSTDAICRLGATYMADALIRESLDTCSAPLQLFFVGRGLWFEFMMILSPSGPPLCSTATLYILGAVLLNCVIGVAHSCAFQVLAAWVGSADHLSDCAPWRICVLLQVARICASDACRLATRAICGSSLSPQLPLTRS